MTVGGEDKDDKEDSDLFSGVKASGPGGEDLDKDKVAAADDAAKTEAEKNDVTGRKPEQAKPDDGLADATAQKGFIVD